MTDSRGAAPTRTKRRPERRDQILQVAVRLFHERGFPATGMDDTEDRAEMRSGESSSGFPN